MPLTTVRMPGGVIVPVRGTPIRQAGSSSGLLNPALLRGLVAYYLLNGGGGSTIQDLSGNGNSGAWGDPTQAAYGQSPLGTAASFSGVSGSVISISDTAGLHGVGPAFTAAILGMFPASSVSNGGLFVRRNGSDQQSTFQLLKQGSNPIMAYRVGNTTTFANTIGSTTVFDNKLHVVALTYDSTAMTSYVDGKLDVTGTLAGPAYAGTSPISLMTQANASFSTGLVVWAMIWSRVLLLSELMSLSNRIYRPI